LWLQWVLANAVGDVVGLGLAGAVGVGLALTVGEPKTIRVALMMAATIIVIGTCEGGIVGLAQWLVLRRHVYHAKWWLLANAAAWAVGMPVVFAGAGAAPTGGFSLSFGVIAIAVIASAGAVVGAIHGIALVWLLHSPQLEAQSSFVNSANVIRSSSAFPKAAENQRGR
jgi:hypothetical protein